MDIIPAHKEVSARAAEIRCASSKTAVAGRPQYNVHKVDIIPAHKEVSAQAAEIRCASGKVIVAGRPQYNVHKVDIILLVIRR